MDMVKVNKLISMLDECLASANQECGKKACTNFDERNKTITIKFDYVEIEEDNFIGFDGY